MQSMKLLIIFAGLLLQGQNMEITYNEVALSPGDQQLLKAAQDKITQAQADLASLELKIKEAAVKGSTSPPPTQPALRAAKAAGKCAVVHSQASFHGDRILVTTTTHNLCSK